MPIPVIGLLNEDKVFVDGSCVLNEERFMLIGSFVAFFIPLVIMVVTYCLTIQVHSCVLKLLLLFPVFNPPSCFDLPSCAGAPEAGNCLPVRSEDLFPAAFKHASNHKHSTAAAECIPPSTDQYARPSRLTR